LVFSLLELVEMQLLVPLMLQLLTLELVFLTLYEAFSSVELEFVSTQLLVLWMLKPELLPKTALLTHKLEFETLYKAFSSVELEFVWMEVLVL
jgi:hypothetical protein